jgi:hypothetical protein
VAIWLKGLTRAADVGPDGFCAYHTVAIENDLILSTSALPLQAAVLATVLWSWRHVRAIANRPRWRRCCGPPGPAWPIPSMWPMAWRRCFMVRPLWRHTPPGTEARSC